MLTGHDRTRFQRPGRLWPRTVELQSTAWHVLAPHLRSHARARAAEHHGRRDVGTRKKDQSGIRGGPKGSLRWMEGYERIAEEIDASEGAKPIECRLLTNRQAGRYGRTDRLVPCTMRSGRTCPDLDEELFFDPDEIQAAYLLHDKVPPNKLTLN